MEWPSMSEYHITEADLDGLRRLSELASPAPWRAMVEGRDHTSGDSFIMVGNDGDRDEDMYISRDSGPAAAVDLDFIAAARNYLPRLLEEIAESQGQAVKELATPQQGLAIDWGAVATDERTLLQNLLDSLDRLYDRACGPVDVDALLTATASVVMDQSWIASIEQASAALGDLIRSRLPAEVEYKRALIVTNDLRIKLANYYE
jgi:hypothetical protein